MWSHTVSGILVENRHIKSIHLKRDVKVDLYLPRNIRHPENLPLLLINDGQDMLTIGFDEMLDNQIRSQKIHPMLVVAIHCGPERRMEYGVASQADYAGRGAKADLYTRFILEELLPFIHENYKVYRFREVSFAGFSLGGLSALDIAWNHSYLFKKVGVFSGSLWWRSKSLEDDYNEDTDRIIHAQIRKGSFKAGLKFFFETGTLDETMDRNQNGIIDSIDDTLALIGELEKKGYDKQHDIHYLELVDGKHDVETWGRAMPAFLHWGWGFKG
jgi:enterochelin esterase-like enzyme